jgi:dTDP-4-dehydrorhamnose 3,5-epimerase
VQVPPGVWNGFVGLRDYPSMVCNCATLPHDPDEITRRDPDDPEFPYAWPVPH